jgi:hypothetical protein
VVRGRFVVASVAALVLGGLVPGQAAVAGRRVSAPGFDSHGCAPGNVCLWSRPNFTGTMKSLSKKGCYTDMPFIASVVDNSESLGLSAFKGPGQPCRLDPLASTGRPARPHHVYPEFDVHDTSYLIRTVTHLPTP